tara:strand:+ start:231 stop:353 length:123 start_codon:yes stop_codon:yes gene_type:complete
MSAAPERINTESGRLLALRLGVLAMIIVTAIGSATTERTK